MPVTVNKLDYIYKKLLYEARQKMNDTVEISDEEYGNIYGDNSDDENDEEFDGHIIYRKNITLNLVDNSPNYRLNYLTNDDFNDGDIICIMLNNIDEYKLIGEDQSDNYLKTYGYMNNISIPHDDIDNLDNHININNDITNYLWIVEKYNGHLKFKNYKSQKYITYNSNYIDQNNTNINTQPIYTANINNENIINYLWDIDYSYRYETYYCGIKNLENNNWNGGWNDNYQHNSEIYLYNGQSLDSDTGNKLVIYKVTIDGNTNNSIIYRKNITLSLFNNTLNLIDNNPIYITNNDFNNNDIICIMLHNIDEYRIIGEDQTNNHLRTYGYINNIEGYNRYSVYDQNTNQYTYYGSTAYDIDNLNNLININDNITNYLWIVEKYNGHLKFKNYKSHKYITYDPNSIISTQPIYTENINNNKNIINYLWDIEYSERYETHYCGIKNLKNNNWNGGWNDYGGGNKEVHLLNNSFLNKDSNNKLVIYKVSINENH